MRKVSILILAAGAARRMGGRDKLLMPVFGVPLLRHVATRAQATGAAVLVALPAGNGARRAVLDRMAVLDGLAVRPVMVADAAEGMGASLRAGVAVLGADVAALVVALADMPDIGTEDYLSLIKAFQDDPDVNIHRAASSDGRAGNPVLLPRWAFADQAFGADHGARDLLGRQRARVRLVALDGTRALCDLDTPADWQAWRAKNDPQ